MHYEFNVAFNGKHLFATHERSVRTVDEMHKLADVMRRKFPTSEGFTVCCTRFESSGRDVDLSRLHDIMAKAGLPDQR